MIPNRLLVALLALCVTFQLSHAQVQQVSVSATPIASFDLKDPDKKRFGSLEFVGGLVLRSTNNHLGALSGLRIRSDEITAVSDTGFWFQGKIERNEAGFPRGIADGRIAPVLDQDGKPFIQKWDADLEGLTYDGEVAYISTEMDARVLRVQPAPDILVASTRRVTSEFSNEVINPFSAFEAIATLPPGHKHNGGLLLLSEASLDDVGNIRAFIMAEGSLHGLSVKKRNGFSITDADFLPGGELLILERRYSLARGAQMRIRRITGDSIAPGALLDGEVILEAGRHQQVDNMEGLSVFVGPGGTTRIGLVSDNNHWLLQRTLYLEFQLLG